MSDVVVFLGPTLPVAEAKQLVRATFLPPARQGDVFRVLSDRPGVIVLIDGVFEAVPSVWHHELRAALASGVHLVGASSMGALRAAELHGEGMLPVGASRATTCPAGAPTTLTWCCCTATPTAPTSPSPCRW